MEPVVRADLALVRAKLVTGALAAGVVVWLAFASGGYFASEWGLLTLGFLLLALGVCLLADSVELGRPGVVMLAAVAGLALWQLGSVLWSPGAALPVAEAERTLLYLTAAAALVIALRPETVGSLQDGIVGGTTVVALYALGTRLAPGTLGGAYDPSSGYQLAKPIGYWNALGLLAVLGMLPALAAVLQPGRLRGLLAAMTLVPLTACLYFTFSRGSLAALGLALAALVGLQQARVRAALHLAVLLLVPLLAVALAARSSALTAPGATLETAQHEGHRVAWQLLALSALAGAVQLVAAWALARVTLGRALGRWLTVAAAAFVLAGAVVAVEHEGGPGTITQRAREAFARDPPATTASLDRRLLSVSGHGRSDYWRVALRMVAGDPALGAGAGSFDRVWARERPVANDARDAHNLYLETLAELGPVGLVLVLTLLLAPVAVLRRARRAPAAAPAAAMLLAFAVHAGVDWDWEIPLLALVALAAGATLVVLDPSRRRVALTSRRRWAIFGAIAVAGALALVTHVGNRAAADSLDALANDAPERAAADARKAASWMPWSPQGDQLLGEAFSLERRDVAARAAFRRALARDDSDWSSWYDLASVTTGPERARALTRSRELNPLSVEIQSLVAESEEKS
jgi:hypothetical protein